MPVSPKTAPGQTVAKKSDLGSRIRPVHSGPAVSGKRCQKRGVRRVVAGCLPAQARALSERHVDVVSDRGLGPRVPPELLRGGPRPLDQATHCPHRGPFDDARQALGSHDVEAARAAVEAASLLEPDHAGAFQLLEQIQALEEDALVRRAVEAARAAVAFECLCQPEVQHPDGAVVAHLDVRGLQIPMDDPASCAASSASAICFAMGNASSMGIGPSSERYGREMLTARGLACLLEPLGIRPSRGFPSGIPHAKPCPTGTLSAA